MLKKIAVLALALMVYSNPINALFTSSPTKEHCSQKLVELLETNSDQSKIRELFVQCSKHGTPEQQIKTAATLAHTLKKPLIEEKCLQSLHEINLEQQNNAAHAKQDDSWRWYHWFALAWASLGCCVAAQNQVEEYYANQPREVEQTEEEKAEAAKKKKMQQQKQKRLVEVY